MLLLLGAASLAETPLPPAPTRWVTDTANFLSPATASALDARLAAYQQGTGHQLIVFIAPTTGGAPIEDWAVRAFAKWKVGRKGMDDGLAVFIMSQDHKLRIEVGYGLESVVPDATASRVINETMVPRIQSGDRDGAVTAGIDALTAKIGGQAVPPPAPLPAAEQPRPISMVRMVFYGIIGILLLLFAITHPALAFYFLASMLSGGREGYGSGGGGFGGGGFSGGGGRSGGGGASGSW